MKKVLLIVGLLLAVPTLLFGLYAALLTSWLVLPTIIPPCFVPTSYHLTRIHWMVKHPKLAWEDDPEQAFEHLKQCKPDKRHTAMAMLAHNNGTVASLGMDIVVQESFEDSDTLLMQFSDDKRWNHNLALNDQYSRFLLAVWRMKKNIPLSEEDREAMADWTGPYFKRLGALPPDKDGER